MWASQPSAGKVTSSFQRKATFLLTNCFTGKCRLKFVQHTCTLPCARLLLLGALPPHPCPGSVEPCLWPRLFSDALRSVCRSCPGCGKDPDPPRAGCGGSSVYLVWHSALGKQRRTQQSLPCTRVTPAWVKMSGPVQECPGLRGLFPAVLRVSDREGPPCASSPFFSCLASPSAFGAAPLVTDLFPPRHSSPAPVPSC